MTRRFVLLFWAVVAILCAQTTGTKATFEVASMKLSSGGFTNFKLEPNKLLIQGFPLRQLIAMAYQGLPDNVLGPNGKPLARPEQERYNIEGHFPNGTSREETLRMFQNLLAERLGLKVTVEQRETKAIVFGPPPTGKTLRRIEFVKPSKEPPTQDPMFFDVRNEDIGGGFQATFAHTQATNMKGFVSAMMSMTGRKIIDETGFADTVIMKMRWPIELKKGVPLGENIVNSFWDIGLPVTERKSSVMVIVVTHIGKLVDN